MLYIFCIALLYHFKTREEKMFMSEKKIIEQAYPSLNITQKTIDGILRRPSFYRGHVRTSIGKIYTTTEFKKRSDDVLGKRMP